MPLPLGAAPRVEPATALPHSATFRDLVNEVPGLFAKGAVRLDDEDAVMQWKPLRFVFNTVPAVYYEYKSSSH